MSLSLINVVVWYDVVPLGRNRQKGAAGAILFKMLFLFWGYAGVCTSDMLINIDT